MDVKERMGNTMFMMIILVADLSIAVSMSNFDSKVIQINEDQIAFSLIIR